MLATLTRQTQLHIRPIFLRLLRRNSLLTCGFIFIVTFAVQCGAQSNEKTPAGDAAARSVDAAAIVEEHREAAIEKWEDDIVALEQLDASEILADDAILFIGSSSVRRWTSMQRDMAPWRTIRRGYGGARFTDLASFAKRLVANHDYQALVIFVANDIAGRDSDRTPEEVLELFKYTVEQVRSIRPAQPIFYIEITPTSSRFSAWDSISQSNQLIRQHCESDPKLHFIQTARAFMNASGRPNDALFVKDRLHLNEVGYKRWAKIIKQHLENVLVRP